MKKSLVALAVLASCGAAMAQSSVTMYGSLDAGIEKTPTRSARVSNNVESNSRIGFRGVEDLGGGLQASFVIETGLRSDTGGFSSNSGLASIGNRQTWLSLGQKGVGTLSFGRGRVAAYNSTAKADPTAASYGQNGDGATMLYSSANNSRFDNVIRFQTAVWSGFSADLAFGLHGDDRELRSPVDGGVTAAPIAPATPAVLNGSATRNISSANKTGYSVHTQYAQGPLYVGFGVARSPARPAPGGGDTDSKVYGASATYDLGVAKLFAGAELDDRYNKNKYAGNLGVKAPLGAGTLMAWYGIDQNGGVGINDKLKSAQVAYSYALSKRTNLYGALTNDTVRGAGTGSPTVVKASNNNTTVRDGTSYQVGINHKF
ncbi:MAG: hypothetical protein CVU30_01215 [Betaproteobacteria bacterium HGW-Betaproteobacteria-3]|jgi:predicted porin|nr:MAG: hypothetical protein CVU30_01215 [Betaproteobacteria bacterium HGW-Betaproteobacteria-3]